MNDGKEGLMMKNFLFERSKLKFLQSKDVQTI